MKLSVLSFVLIQIYLSSGQNFWAGSEWEYLAGYCVYGGLNQFLVGCGVVDNTDGFVAPLSTFCDNSELGFYTNWGNFLYQKEDLSASNYMCNLMGFEFLHYDPTFGNMWNGVIPGINCDAEIGSFNSIDKNHYSVVWNGFISIWEDVYYLDLQLIESPIFGSSQRLLGPYCSLNYEYAP